MLLFLPVLETNLLTSGTGIYGTVFRVTTPPPQPDPWAKLTADISMLMLNATMPL